MDQNLMAKCLNLKLKILQNRESKGIDKANYYSERNWKIDYLSKVLYLHVCCREMGTFQEIDEQIEFELKHEVCNFVGELSKIETIYFLLTCWKFVKKLIIVDIFSTWFL